MMLRDSSLEGYRVPNVNERLITMLFVADDTTVYLSSSDRWEDLMEILDTWCRVSGAKFNIEKTQVVPIGDPTYRSTVLETRKLNPAHTSEVRAIAFAWQYRVLSFFL